MCCRTGQGPGVERNFLLFCLKLFPPACEIFYFFKGITTDYSFHEILLIYLWLYWVFIAVHRIFSSYGEWGGGLLSSCGAGASPSHHVAQTVKNLLAREPGFDSWVREIPWRNGCPLQYSCLGNPTDRGDWRTTVYGLA